MLYLIALSVSLCLSLSLPNVFYALSPISSLVQVNCPQNQPDPTRLSISQTLSFHSDFGCRIVCWIFRKMVCCFVLPTLLFVLIVILLLLMLLPLLLVLVLLVLKKTRITIRIKINSWNLLEISANLEALGMLIMPYTYLIQCFICTLCLPLTILITCWVPLQD